MTLAAGLVAPPSRRAIPDGPRSCAAVLDVGVRDRPDHPALIGRSGRYTYRELDVAADRAAHALATLGVSTGDRVAMSLPNDVDIVVAFLACMRAGAIWLGVNRALAPTEKAYMVRDAQAALLLVDPEVAGVANEDLDGTRVMALAEWRALVTDAPLREVDTSLRDVDAPLRDIDPGAPAAIAYTSGTTGFPKGAVHSQHNLLLPGAVARRRRQYDADERVGVVLPLTLVNLIALGPVLAFQLGATCVAVDRTDAPGLAAWIREERITAMATVPTMLHDLLTHPDVDATDLESLRVPGVGGADLPESFRALYRERFGTEVTIGYGLTEAPTAVTMTDPSAPPVPGSAGRALPHVRLVVVDDEGRAVEPGVTGEICIGATTDGDWAGVYTPMLGYWNRPDATADALRDGLLHTGDVGYLDENGELFVLDRRGDLIIRGGANVYPAEVERVLQDEPRVVACAVVGTPDERLGERVVAFVQLGDGTTATADELLAWCRPRLARYKLPEELHFVERFDRTPMGKITKRALREQLLRD